MVCVWGEGEEAYPQIFPGRGALEWPHAAAPLTLALSLWLHLGLSLRGLGLISVRRRDPKLTEEPL